MSERFEERINGIQKQIMKTNNYERKNKVNKIVLYHEKKQLEQWANKKCSEVIFDTDRDGYPKNKSSTFRDKVMNKNDLIFFVEDENGNRFSEYLHSKITK